MIKISFYANDLLIGMVFEQGEVSEVTTKTVKSVKLIDHDGYTFPRCHGLDIQLVGKKDDVLTIKYEPVK